MRTRVYKRDDPIWPWGYYVAGYGYFVTDSREDAERKAMEWKDGTRRHGIVMKGKKEKKDVQANS